MESLKYIRIIIIVMILILSVFWIKSCKNKRVEKKEKEKTEEAKLKSNALPDTVIEYKLLVKGAEPIRVQKDGYKCQFYGGGKQYYNQPQNSTKEVWGGGACPSNLNFPNASYSDLSFYREEVTVKCVFILKK